METQLAGDLLFCYLNSLLIVGLGCERNRGTSRVVRIIVARLGEKVSSFCIQIKGMNETENAATVRQHKPLSLVRLPPSLSLDLI